MLRAYPNVVVRAASPFHSDRTRAIQLIVVHATCSTNRAGTEDLAAIGAWFQNPAAQVSAHVCTDADGNSARYVPDQLKAWHCAGFNSASLGVEQVGQVTDYWLRPEVRETARWVALWSRRHNIPIRQGVVNQTGAVIVPGVVRHSDLGAMGGNHDDPGTSYPWRTLLGLARYYKALQTVRHNPKH